VDKLNKTLEEFVNKSLKVVKSVDKFVNGIEKQLVLEVGSHTTKVVEYLVKDKEIEVRGGALLNTPVNAVQNDRLVEIDILANMLEQTLKEEKIKTKEFVASIASKEIIIREMNVPKMKAKEIKSFVQINSNDIFPVKLSNYVLTYNMIEKGVNDRVMIAAIPKDIVETYIQLGNKLGLSLKGVNYSGYELYNFLDYEIGANMSTYLAFDVGAKNTNIIIISNGVLKFNKIIPKGSEQISDFICEEFNCSFTKAEQLKRQYNTIEASSDNIEEVSVVKYTRRCIDDILQDIQRIIEFFNSNNPKNKITKIYALGGASKIGGVDNYIASQLNIETEAFKVFNKVVFGKNAVKLKTRQQSFINCFGAHKLKDREFYLIKSNLGFKNVSILLKPKFHKIVLCAILFFVAALVVQNNSIKELENKINLYTDYVAKNRELLALRGELEAKIEQVENKKQIIDSLGTGIEKHAEILNQLDKSILEQKVNASINITNYKFQQKAIEVKFKVQIEEINGEIDSNYYNLPFDLEETVEKNTGKLVDVTANSLRGNIIEFGLKISI